MNYQPKADTEKKKYHQDLSQLADERMRYRQLNRLKDNQEGMLVGITHGLFCVLRRQFEHGAALCRPSLAPCCPHTGSSHALVQFVKLYFI